MIAELGNYALALSLAIAILLAIVVLIVQSLSGKSAVLKSIKREQQREARLQQMKQKGDTL